MNRKGGLSSSYLRPLVLIAAIVLVAILAWRQGYFDLGSRERMVASIQYAQGVRWAAPLFVLLYMAAVAFTLPTTVLTILGGAVFGFMQGVALSWLAALAGTAVVHRLAGSLLKGRLERRITRHRLAKKLHREADIVSLMRVRVLPLAPFGVLPYVAGLVSVPLRKLLLATAVATIPSMTVYAYAGDRLHAAMLDPASRSQDALIVAGLVSLLVAALAILPKLSSWVRSRAN